MQELIDRLEAAAGPDRELDRAIHIAIEGNTVVPNYTGSLDAAMMLVPEQIYLEIETGSQKAPAPSHQWPLIRCGSQITGDEIWSGQPKTLPIAICIAALKARATAR